MPRAADRARARAAVPSVRTLDAAAARALDAIDDTAAQQLRALAALRALADACESDVKGSVLADAVRATLRVRTEALGARHRTRVQAALDAFGLRGPRAQPALVRALEECIAFLRANDGVTGEVRTLERQLMDAKNGHGGAPRPFFARFLEDGRQPRR